MSDLKQEIISQVYQAAPSAGALAYTGLTFENWLSIMGMGFIALQAAYLIWRWIREARKK